MKDIIFEIRNNWMNLYSIEEDIFHPMIGLAFDYVKEEKGNQNTKSINQFIQLMQSCGAKTGTEFEYQYFKLTDLVKQNYFKDKFIKVKSIINKMTLEQFSSDVSYLIDEIENNDDIFVFDESAVPMSLDHWMRNAEPGRYYVGATFYTH